MALTDKLTAIADAIRGKTGGSDALTLEQMVTEIEGISAGGSDEWIGDGNTHIWITLHEGRTSPMLGVCPKGTVTVDWGDGTTPDVLTGTSTSTVKWTPTHNYTKPGDYVITLTVDGEMGFSGYNNFQEGGYILRHSTGLDFRNNVYTAAVQKVEMGIGVTCIGNYAFFPFYALSAVSISDSVTKIERNAFANSSLESIYIPNSVTSVANYVFQECRNLSAVSIPNSLTSIGQYTFGYCSNLSAVSIPNSVTTIDKYAFYYCGGVAHYDFTKHTKVPTLSATSAFINMPADCEIRVPAALYDEWIAATNWATYASYIKAV